MLTVEVLAIHMCDKIIIFKKVDYGFEDLYKGDVTNIPCDLLKMQIRGVYARRKNVIEVCV